MAFITVSGQVVSFADYQDVLDIDQRLFDTNEIQFSNTPRSPTSLNEYLEDLAMKSTTRIKEKIRASAQWRMYTSRVGNNVGTNALPEFNTNYVKLRQADFTDLTVYYLLKEFLLPKIADFGNPNSPEVQKIEFYDTKFSQRLDELLTIIDWYDNDGDGTIGEGEREIRFRPLRRSRGRHNTARIA